MRSAARHIQYRRGRYLARGLAQGRRGGGGRQMRRVLLVEDHAAFREALATLLNMQPDLEVVGRAGSLAEGRAAAALEEADIVVVDYFLPDGNGAELVRELRRRADPRLSILMLTAGVDPELHALAFEAGADEVCVKAQGLEEIIEAIRGNNATDR